MRLASDIITVKHQGAILRLRPSLRAAVRLHAAYGLPEIVTGLAEGNFGIAVDTIMEATDQETGLRIANDLAYSGFASIDAFVDPLTDFVFALLGKDINEPAQPRSASVTSTEKSDWIGPYLDDLFEKATGWLGWSPTDAWDATPREIHVATHGLIAKLKAIHGSADDKPDFDPNAEVSPAEVREGIEKLRHLAGQGAC